MLPLSFSYLSYEEHKKNTDMMCEYDKTLYESMTYKDGVDDIQQIIASLKCVIPDAPVDTFDTIASNKNVTGTAHNLSYK